MEKVFKIFHYLSFIKYPILIIAVYYSYKPIFSDGKDLLESYNYALIFLGLGMGFDSLKNYGKLTWLDKKVYHKPKVAKYYFSVLGLLILSLVVFGAIGYFSTAQSALKELSIGLIIIGIGTIALLKAGMQATKNFIESEK
ncbi:hypothetical protein SAMN05661096_03351 [Marivirga sericea]|uniref:Uncharacterized protein n=1 Tax=Marivirga sericea TaxID=1028 RepID=A0A1X7KZT8_9BACT|nr:hypothetical protein [Marivirga sericea]SMG47108.1 hypothetical protein SAMN05661096_03351 [Marivirga sericea]